MLNRANDELKSSDDELKSSDDDFNRNLRIVMGAVDGLVDAKTAETAAHELTQAALQSGDRIKLAFLLGRFEDYVSKGVTPPLAMLTGISEAFTRFRSGKLTMDEAFGLRNKKRGKPACYVRREIARTHAVLVKFLMSEGATLEVAIEQVAGNSAVGHQLSESQIKRNYLAYKKSI